MSVCVKFQLSSWSRTYFTSRAGWTTGARMLIIKLFQSSLPGVDWAWQNGKLYRGPFVNVGAAKVTPSKGEPKEGGFRNDNPGPACQTDNKFNSLQINNCMPSRKREGNSFLYDDLSHIFQHRLGQVAVRRLGKQEGRLWRFAKTITRQSFPPYRS